MAKKVQPNKKQRRVVNGGIRNIWLNSKPSPFCSLYDYKINANDCFQNKHSFVL
jgi:hypothetical protein